MTPIHNKTMPEDVDAMMRRKRSHRSCGEPKLKYQEKHRGPGRGVAISALLLGVTVWSVACMGDKGTAPSLRPAATTLGTVRVSPINAIMAVGDTMSLTLSGRSVSGVPLTSFDSIEYILQNPTDTLRTRISSGGLVTAVSPSGTNNQVLVEVIGFKDGVARADQAVIQIVSSAFSGATLSIHPVPPDSTKLEWGDTKTITPIIQNSTGQSVLSPRLRYEYGPGDSTTLQCYIPNFVATATLTQTQLQVTDCGQNGNAGQVSLNQIHVFSVGTAWIHANVTVFGIPLEDSVMYTLTNPYSGSVSIGPTNLSPTRPAYSSVFIAPGGTVTFVNSFPAAIGASVSWTFDNPAAATAATPPATYGDSIGNISAINASQFRSTRRFRTAGVYTWTAKIIGGIAPYNGATTTGQITVQ